MCKLLWSLFCVKNKDFHLECEVWWDQAVSSLIYSFQLDFQLDLSIFFYLIFNFDFVFDFQFDFRFDFQFDFWLYDSKKFLKVKFGLIINLIFHLISVVVFMPWFIYMIFTILYHSLGSRFKNIRTEWETGTEGKERKRVRGHNYRRPCAFCTCV